MKKQDYILMILFIISTYLASVSMYQRLINPKLTETELFLLYPNNLLLNFK